jgi:hypothetical protein
MLPNLRRRASKGGWNLLGIAANCKCSGCGFLANWEHGNSIRFKVKKRNFGQMSSLAYCKETLLQTLASSSFKHLVQLFATEEERGGAAVWTVVSILEQVSLLK